MASNELLCGASEDGGRLLDLLLHGRWRRLAREDLMPDPRGLQSPYRIDFEQLLAPFWYRLRQFILNMLMICSHMINQHVANENIQDNKEPSK